MTFGQTGGKCVDFTLKTAIYPRTPLFHHVRRDHMPLERKICTILGVYEGIEELDFEGIKKETVGIPRN